MPDLQKKVQTALDEVRILVLVVQVVLGFDFQAPFLHGFDALPESSRWVKTISLAILLLSLAVLLLPAAFHHIVEHGEDTPRFTRLITIAAAIGMAPLAIGVGSEVYIAAHKIAGNPTGLLIGLALGAASLWLWYGLSLTARRPGMQSQNTAVKPTGIEDKVDQALTEARVVLPGSQALLGFQLAVTFTQTFDRLPPAARQTHLASLCVVAVSAILLMTPAAVHRLGEKGEPSDRFLRFTERMLLAAMGFLALGTSADFGLIVWTIFRNDAAAWISGTAALAFFMALWFAYPLWIRARIEHTPSHIAIERRRTIAG